MTPRRCLTIALLGSCAVLGSVPPLQAATKVFRQSSARDFEEGEAIGAAILPEGEVIPGLATSRLAVDAAFVWCSAPSRDGRSLFVGTGDDGKIFTVPAPVAAAAPPARSKGSVSGPAAAPAARLLVKLDSPWVSALAVRADGQLLAAANPGGQVVLVDPARGTQGLFAQVPATHIWALWHEERSRETFVATGLPGKIFVLDPTGKVRPLWSAHDEHVLALWREEDGTLLAGTSSQAILYRVSANGHAEAWHDFEADEVRAIVRAPSGLYVAVNDFETATPPAAAAVTTPVAAKGTKVVVPGGAGTPAAGSTTAATSTALLPRPGARKAKAALYRIDREGRIEEIFTLGDGYLTSLLVADDGAVLAAAGAQGRVYRVPPNDNAGNAAVVIDVPERQVLTLARASQGAAAGAAAASSGGVWLGTGDAASVYLARADVAAGGRYLSKVLDAEYPADWGALHWEGAGIAFETRVGNTARPDDSWQEWRPLGAVAVEALAGVGHVAGNKGRYLQYRCRLQGATARLRSVTTYFVPQNQRARVTQIALGAAALADAGAGSSAGVAGGASGGAAAGAMSALGASAVSTTPSPRPAHSPVLKLRWRVDNDDDDELVYRLTFRALDGTVWRDLAGQGGATGEPLTKAEFDWNTETLPDGRYIVRVTASDERAQPIDRALSSSLDSEPLLVDNRKPDVAELVVKSPHVRGKAEDRASPISQIEVALDGGPWRTISPVDGIADERVESFSFDLPPTLRRGAHSLSIRATDSNDNVGAIQVEVLTP